jgi:hypothetical protein
MGTNPPETFLQLLQSFHIYVRADLLASGEHVYENHPNTVAIILLVEGTALNFFFLGEDT